MNAVRLRICSVRSFSEVTARSFKGVGAGEHYGLLVFGNGHVVLYPTVEREDAPFSRRRPGREDQIAMPLRRSVPALRYWAVVLGARCHARYRSISSMMRSTARTADSCACEKLRRMLSPECGLNSVPGVTLTAP